MSAANTENPPFSIPVKKCTLTPPNHPPPRLPSPHSSLSPRFLRYSWPHPKGYLSRGFSVICLFPSHAGEICKYIDSPTYKMESSTGLYEDHCIYIKKAFFRLCRGIQTTFANSRYFRIKCFDQSCSFKKKS